MRLRRKLKHTPSNYQFVEVNKLIIVEKGAK